MKKNLNCQRFAVFIGYVLYSVHTDRIGLMNAFPQTVISAQLVNR